MAASPRWKVYDSRGKYQAACHEIEAAAVVVAFYGAGATIRSGHRTSQTVWTEGTDGDAAESYDAVATTAHDRMLCEAAKAAAKAAVRAARGAVQAAHRAGRYELEDIDAEMDRRIAAMSPEDRAQWVANQAEEP